MIVCLTCGCHFTGIARVGMPCSSCPGTLVDLAAEVARLAPHFDGARCVVLTLRRALRR